MKLQYYAVILMVVLFSLPEKAVGQVTESQLIGTWTFNFDLSLTKVTPFIQDRLSTNTNLLVSLESMYRGRQVTLSNDFSFLQKLANGQMLTGTWQLASGGSVINIVDASNNAHSYTIEGISATSLILRPTLEGKSIMMLPVWYFTKN